MTKLQQLEADSLTLSDADRATLAARLLATLPAVLSEPDEGVAEALRRDAELDARPDTAVAWHEIKRQLGR